MMTQIASRKASEVDRAAYPDSSNSLLEGIAVSVHSTPVLGCRGPDPDHSNTDHGALPWGQALDPSVGWAFLD